MKSKKHVLIIGCSKLGASIANILYEKGDDVLIIDKSQNSFKNLSSSFGGINLCIDATNIGDLIEANIYNYDIAIVLTGKDTTNIMISEILKEEFSVKSIITRLINSSRSFSFNSDINFISPEIIELEKINELISRERR